jgi:hypothetical protein
MYVAASLPDSHTCDLSFEKRRETWELLGRDLPVRFCSRTIVSICADALFDSTGARRSRIFPRNMHANERSRNTLVSVLVGSHLLCEIECISCCLFFRVTEVKAFVVLPFFRKLKIYFYWEIFFRSLESDFLKIVIKQRNLSL